MFGHKQRKIDAVEIIKEIDGRILENDLKRCCHCGNYWKKIIGSGRIRGWCRKCDDDICGRPGCLANCVPYEKWIDTETKEQDQLIKLIQGI